MTKTPTPSGDAADNQGQDGPPDRSGRSATQSENSGRAAASENRQFI